MQVTVHQIYFNKTAFLKYEQIISSTGISFTAKTKGLLFCAG